MEATVVKGCVSGPIEGKKQTGKGMILFQVHKIIFSLPRKSTYARDVMGAARAIVLYEETPGESMPRITQVICNHTNQQMIKVHASFSP